MRREKLARTLKADRADAYLISNATNVRYLTGFTGEDAVLLLTGKRAMLISDGRFTTQLEQECPDLEVHIRSIGQGPTDAVALLAPKLGIGRLAFEAVALSVADFESLKAALPGVALTGVRDRVEALRAIKDRQEIEAIREAIDVAERAFAMLRNGLRIGETEKDVADAAGIPPSLRRDDGEFPADRRGRRARGAAAREADVRNPDRRRGLRAGRLGGDVPAL